MEKTGGAARGQTGGLPARAGVGLKAEHFRDVITTRPNLGFFEVHAENYMVAGGPYRHFLSRIREHYALSMHGVGLSIGGEKRPDRVHLDRLVALLNRYEPQVFSEHLAWTGHGSAFLNDLLPIAYNHITLQRVCEHVDEVQCQLKRRILLENPATYVEFAESDMAESDFMNQVVRNTGCGLLLDVSNVYVSSVNHHRDPYTSLRDLPLDAVEEVHLAGFSCSNDASGDSLLIDSHDDAIAPEVWDLYAFAIDSAGPVATLIERDGNIPPLRELLTEAERADIVLRAHLRRSGGRAVD